MCWTVVCPHRAQLTAEEVRRRLRGGPDTMTAVFLEQRGDAVIIVG